MIYKRNRKARLSQGKSAAYDELVDAMVSWNLRRFSIGIMQFFDESKLGIHTTGNTPPKETKENDIILQWIKIFKI